MYFLQNSYISLFAEELKKMKAYLMAIEKEKNPSRFDTSDQDNMNVALQKIKAKENKTKKPDLIDDFSEKVQLKSFSRNKNFLFHHLFHAFFFYAYMKGYF